MFWRSHHMFDPLPKAQAESLEHPQENGDVFWQPPEFLEVGKFVWSKTTLRERTGYKWKY